MPDDNDAPKKKAATEKTRAETPPLSPEDIARLKSIVAETPPLYPEDLGRLKGIGSALDPLIFKGFDSSGYIPFSGIDPGTIDPAFKGIDLGALTGFDAAMALLGRDPNTIAKVSELQGEVQTLRAKMAEKVRSLSEAQGSLQESRAIIAALREQATELGERERIQFLLTRVHPKAEKLLLEDSPLKKQFLQSGACEAFVLSVDIRRSTELMLKARSAEQFEVDPNSWTTPSFAF